MGLAVVWFKRDLRIHDHVPLAEACESGRKLVCLYVVEPSLWALPEYAGRHYAFLQETLESLAQALHAKGAALTVRVGEVVDVLDALHREHGVESLHAHEETGLIATWERDKQVATWAQRHDVAFREHPQFGVIRGLESRDGWARKWDRFMERPVTPAPQTIDAADLESDAIPEPGELDIEDDPCPGRQTGGRRAAVEDLGSFLKTRGDTYRKAMSSPVTAYEACSRMSAHLSLGAISMRETYQAGARALKAKRRDGETRYAQSIDSFISRLHWHCHFMQKFEDDPEIERRDLHPAYRGVRPDPDPKTVARWIDGRTGFPFVDACMRALKHTGWLNFRMRAMVAAVSSYHFWVWWKAPAVALARRFTDFEPGIHYSQFQMQSGTTGVNTPRIYNPVKQGYDQDPDGAFTKRWVPELADLPAAFIHEPWKAERSILDKAGVTLGETYPERLVDHVEAAREARSKIASLRGAREHKDEADRIQSKHGSRKSGMRRTGSASSRRKAKTRDDGQGAFDFSGRK